MFDIGFSELLLIAVVALVVLGPERLPRAAKFAGLWVRRARAQWYSVKTEFEREIAADELRRSVEQARDSVREADAVVRGTSDGIERDAARLKRAVEETPKPATPREPEPPGPALPESNPSDPDPPGPAGGTP